MMLDNFLAAFFADPNETIWFRAFKPKLAPNKSDNFVLNKSVTRAALQSSKALQNELVTANQTRGWYFVPNSGGGTNEQITRFNAFFVEIDMAEECWCDEARRKAEIERQFKIYEQAALPPSVITETLRGLSAFWLINPVRRESLNAWKQVQKRLIEVFNADEANKNEARLMRLPCFNHVRYDPQSGDYLYREVQIVKFDAACRYSLAEMQAAYPTIEKQHNRQNHSSNGNGAGHSAPPVDDEIREGTRRKKLLSLAGSMRRRGMTADEIFAALRITNIKRCRPPLDESEVRGLCDDVESRYKPAQDFPEDHEHFDNELNEHSQGKVNHTLAFTTLDDLLVEPEEETAFVWDKTLPVGGFSICSAKPKVGKSTTARNLAVCISRGEPFLGRDTQQGTVLYLCLEEKRAEVKKHFAAMQASGTDILIYTGATPENALNELAVAIADYEPVLVIIDPLSRVLRVRDFNDYGGMSRGLEPFIDLARKLNTHILALHHDGKGERDGGDALLGSTALFGAVDCHIQMKKRERRRTILTTNRYGEDLPETVIELQPDTGIISNHGDLETANLADKKNEVLACLGDDEELTEGDIKKRIGGKQGLISKAIRELFDSGQLSRSGQGKRGNPYLYRKVVCIGDSDATHQSENGETRFSGFSRSDNI
jgi:hypothetical protein